MVKKISKTKQTEQLLSDILAYKNSLAYLRNVAECGTVPNAEAENVRKQIRYLECTIEAVENAFALLSDVEYDIITNLYLVPGNSVEDLCEMCALERSSVYRYRASALRKLAKAVYGAEA